MALTLPYPTLGPGVVNSAEIVSNFSAIATKLSNIDNSDISNNAGIAVSKLSASYEYVVAVLAHSSAAGGMITTGRVLAACPMYNDSKGAWTAVNYTWHCDNVGAKTGAFDLLWGYYDAAGAFQTTTTLKNAELLDGGTANLPFNDGAALGTSLAWTTDRMQLQITVDTADAAAMSTANDKLVVSVLLKRQITT